MSKMKTSLYNQDGSLCSEAQLLLSTKPDEMSLAEWRKTSKELKASLSSRDLAVFKKLRAKKSNKKNYKKHYNKNYKKIKERRDKWRAMNPEYNAKYYVNNHEKLKKKRKAYYDDNCEKTKEYYKKYYIKNCEKAKNESYRWRAKNPEYMTYYMKDYHKQRRAEDPLYRLHCNMRIMGNRVVKQLALGKKPASIEKWQGCTADELKAYLESLFTEGMTWENYGEWHVDHIRPVCSFSAEEWEQINHYTNLQPLWAKDNFAKISSDLKQRKS